MARALLKDQNNQLRRDALAIFKAGLKASDAGEAVRRAWPGIFSSRRINLASYSNVYLLAIGKAASAMASAVERNTKGAINTGIVLTKRGHAVAGRSRCVTFEAAHPVPDEAGVRASNEIVGFLRQLNARDLLIVALSGGASALLSAPAPGITLAAKQRTTELLLRAGATIGELNIVRKHLSQLKGGRMAVLAWPATVVSLILSDVVGDPLDVIASGPTVPDPSTFADAMEVLERYRLAAKVPVTVLRHLQAATAETPKPGEPHFEHVHNFVVGSNRLALEAAAKEARERGYRPLILTSRVQGEAREAARMHAAILREIRDSRHPIAPPVCVLSGGECTVTVRGNGLGGRAQEFALATVPDLEGLAGIMLLSAGTDGTDGPTDAAGAMVTGDSAQRAKDAGLDVSDFLARNDSYTFFDALGDLVKTGPTGTNVMDLCLMLARRS